MTRSKAIRNQLLIAAPWVTVAALMVLSVLLPNRASIGAQAEVRKAEIARAVASVPNFIGRWVGPDSEDPNDRGLAPAAQRLLKPNAFLSRRYTSPGGPWVQIVFVHCSDARDMIGHYPPICYPSAGWMEMPGPANPDHTLTVNGMPFPVREYDFKGYLESGREEVIRIFGAFILPDGAVTREIDDINRQSERLSVAVQGVAQIQIITSGRTTAEEAIGASEEVLNGMNVLFEALQFGAGASS
jgi:hypothetical protein